MSKTKIEKIAGIEEEIKQLKERQKQLQQQHKAEERKARTKRLCSRAGLLESMLPDTIALADEQFKTFLEKTTANDFGRRTLAGIVAKVEVKPLPKPTESVVQNNTKLAEMAQESRITGSADKSNSAERTS